MKLTREAVEKRAIAAYEKGWREIDTDKHWWELSTLRQEQLIRFSSALLEGPTIELANVLTLAAEAHRAIEQAAREASYAAQVLEPVAELRGLATGEAGKNG